MSVLRVTDKTTKAEIEQAIVNVNATLHRMPEHWVDRRARLHEKLDALLGAWLDASN
jgi:hypothetical protein